MADRGPIMEFDGQTSSEPFVFHLHRESTHHWVSQVEANIIRKYLENELPPVIW